MLLWFGIFLLALLGLLVAGLPLWRAQRRGEAVFAGGVMLAIAFAGYLAVGNPGLEPQSRQVAEKAPSVESLVQKLADRLETAPDDIEGWTMLGRAYVMMGRFADAAEAYREVIERKPDPAPGDILNYAETLVLSNPDSLEGKASGLLDRALEAAPNDPRALWYGGLAAETNGNNDLAVERWQRLLQQELPGSFRQIAEERIQRVSPEALDVELTVTVDIAAEVREQLPPEGTLFVTLRKPGAAAGTPPLAARRLASFRYPIDVSFRSQDIFQGDSLPREPLEIHARINATDDALRTDGGLQGTATWDGNSAKTGVTIDRSAQ
ncbi:MAG: tetratricopeptide repeat protein [Gammaproteobacteria bacterium]|nr:tetratricopeptide repeat protein [Gammaproteobacteria bacterium]